MRRKGNLVGPILVVPSLVLLLALVAGCGDDGGAADTGAPGDTGAGDTGAEDSGAADTGGEDSGVVDAGPLVDASRDAGDAASGDAGADGGDGGPGDGGPGDGGMDGAVADAGAPARNRLVYLAAGGVGGRLAVIQLAADGMLTAMPGSDLRFPGSQNPGPMVYARRARRIYTRLGVSMGTIALDAAGVPSFLGSTPVTRAPVYLSLSDDEQMLLSAYTLDDLLRSHDVSGSPPHAPLDLITTSDEPQSALVGPTGRQVYVTHQGANSTRWFDLATDGSLSAGGELASEPNAGPRHIAFHPTGPFAYVINEYSDSVATHRVGTDGALVRVQTISTLPTGVSGASNTAADVHITPDGRFLYGSNRGQDSLAMFSIASDGILTFLGTVPTEMRPTAFDVSPDGRFVVACGQDSGMVQSYRVEGDGTLTSIDRLDVGPALLWVIID